MTLIYKLKYAGAEPFEPEQDRDDIDYHEQELLEQDETYQKLAELRYLADDLEATLSRDVLAAESDAHDAIFEATAMRDAPLQVAVSRYVDAWLADHRADADDQEVPADAD